VASGIKVHGLLIYADWEGLHGSVQTDNRDDENWINAEFQTDGEMMGVCYDP